MKLYKPSRAVTAFVKITGALGAFPFFKYKTYYENKEKQSKKLPKPCILMSNHTYLMDFVLYLTVFPTRYIRFLMAEVLFTKSPALTWLLCKLGGIYVDRDARDFSFMAESIKTLEGGGTVGIFPQSRLPVNGCRWPFKPSIVFIALRSGAPIVPVYTDGQYGIFKRTRIMIGEAVDLRSLCSSRNPDDAEISRLTKLLEDKVYALGTRLDEIRKEETKCR